MKVTRIRPDYVEELPDQMDEGVLYICEDFNLTAHKCCCGCGEDVWNKLGPVKWSLTKEKDGSVTIDPSIGNWKYACQSHYVIRANRVIDAGPMPPNAIEAVKRRDLRDRDAHIQNTIARAAAQEVNSNWSRTAALCRRAMDWLRRQWPW